MTRVFRLNVLCVAVLSMCLVAGCATQKSAQKYSGFLEDYSRLEPVEGTGAERWEKPDVDLSKYDKLMLDRILVWFKEDSEYKGIDPTELKALTDYFYGAIQKEFGEEEFVTEPGPDVLRLRIAVTEVVPTKPGVSVLVFCTPYAWIVDFADNQARGSSYVGAAGVEMEVLDSMTNERLLAYVETKLGDKYKFDFEKDLGEAAAESLVSYGKAYTTWGYVKQAFDHWAKKIHDRWEEVQGRAIASERPGALVVETTTASGVVTAVDREKKIVTIEGAGGAVLELDAKDARNLDQLKVGDTVEAKFIQSVVLAAIRSDSPPSAASQEIVRLAPEGGKPGGVVADVLEITALVEEIDVANRTVTLKGPRGNVRTFEVDDSVRNLDKVEKGDTVLFRYTEAVAISVTKP